MRSWPFLLSAALFTRAALPAASTLAPDPARHTPQHARLTTSAPSASAPSAFETSATETSASALRVARLFADGMVLQRRQPIVVWGWGAPGAVVTASIGAPSAAARAAGARPPVTRTAATRTAATRTARGRVGSDGRWRLTLPAMPAGGPHTLQVASGAESFTYTDVLVGDVWLASGQSNMEWPLVRTTGAEQDVRTARDTRIREFKIPTGYSYAPQDSLRGGSWAPADSAHVGAFSAVAYHFARALRASTPGAAVPIGIINSTWGGSNIETWIAREAQGLDDGAWRALQRRQELERDSVQASLRRKLGAIPTVDAGLENGRGVWAEPALDETGWDHIPVPGYWEPAGYAGMDGVGWYRTTFTLSEAERAAGVTLTIDALDDDDITWVNGREVGRTSGYNVARRYTIPASALVAGRNVLAVRVSDYAGGGGINGAVQLVLANGTARSLAGSWAFRVGRVAFEPDGQVINKVPSVSYNQMVKPLTPFPVAGVIWYQGESNANNDEQAKAYRALFRTLITSWRAERKAPSLPFLWVQLPNYNPPPVEPPMHAGWAYLRESMEAALALPKTGQAVIIDLGESADIHPRNKRDVGERLARVARRVAYGEPIESSGPTYRSHSVRGDTVVLVFDHATGGLRGDASPKGFAIASADKRWAWAQARVEGNRVLVWSDQVRAPVAVRYAWSNGPVGLSLTNTLGLPMAPFRTDRW